MNQARLRSEKVYLSWKDLIKLYPIHTRRFHTIADTFKEFWGPIGEAYGSKFNPVFLFQVLNLTELRTKSHWLARDGRVPLQIFFERFPSPGGLASQIIIGSEFNDLVPSAWNGNVLYYGLQRKAAGTVLSSPPKKLLLHGLVSSSFCSQKNWQLQLQWIHDFCQSHSIENIEVCFIHSPGVLRDQIEQSAFYGEFWKDLFSKFSSATVRVTDWKKIIDQTSFANYWFLDISDKNLLNDSFFDHVIVMKGGTPALCYEDNGGLYDSEPMSMTHALAVSSRPLKAETGFCQFELNDNVYVAFPWHYWYEAPLPVLSKRLVSNAVESFQSGAREYQVVRSENKFSIDSFQLDGDIASFQGWALEPGSNASFERIVIVNEWETQTPKVQRISRLDVLEANGVPATSLDCGFWFEIDLGVFQAPFEIYVLHPSGIAELMGMFKRSGDKLVKVSKENFQSISIQTWYEDEDVLRLKIGESFQEFRRRGADSSLEFCIESFGDECSGWAMDMSRPGPVSSLALVSKDVSFLHIGKRSRRDLKEVRGAAFEHCGFSFQVPPDISKNHKMFCLFSDKTFAEMKT